MVVFDLLKKFNEVVLDQSFLCLCKTWDNLSKKLRINISEGGPKRYRKAYCMRFIENLKRKTKSVYPEAMQAGSNARIALIYALSVIKSKISADGHLFRKKSVMCVMGIN